MKVLNTIKGLSVMLVFAGSAATAQTTADAKKAIDAESYAKAISSLKQLTKVQPTLGENYFLLGQAYLKNDYPDSAKTAFQSGATADPKYALNFVGLGAVELENGNTAGAKTQFDLALTKMDGKKDNKPNLYIGKAYSEAPKPDYKAALPFLEAAMTLNPKDAEAALAMGVAHRGAGDNSAAYGDFGKAIELDKSLTRAKLEQAISIKMAKAYKEATENISAIIAADPNYAPAYRELAETYYQWWNFSTKPEEADERIKLAVQAYEKYMEHTDRSVEKRLRHADYLLLAKDYKALEIEANEMARMDKANLRTLRYLGYSAFENGNLSASIQSLSDFIAKVEARRVISRDYLYLAKAQYKSGDVDAALKSYKAAIKMDSSFAEQMSPIGSELFKAKRYDKSASFYELASLGPKAKVTDFFYVGYSNYFDYKGKFATDTNTSKAILLHADSMFAAATQKKADLALAYLFRARVTRLIDEKLAFEGAMTPHYEKYVELIEAAGVQPADKVNVIEAYNALGVIYARKGDNAKAKAFLDKTLALDPGNTYATQTLQQLASPPAAPNSNPK